MARKNLKRFRPVPAGVGMAGFHPAPAASGRALAGLGRAGLAAEPDVGMTTARSGPPAAADPGRVA